MTSPLNIIHDQRPDGSTVIAVAGEIDMSNAGLITDALKAVEGKVVVDLSAVEYLDSAGLAVLFAHADRIELVANAVLAPVLNFSGIGDLITVHGLPSDNSGAPPPVPTSRDV